MVAVDPTGLRRAALLSCVLFLAEDPAVVALRDRLISASPGQAATTVAIDLVLAVVMVAYNYAAARYVVTRVGADEVMAAIDRVSAEPPSTRVQRWVRHANPFAWVRAVVGRIGRGMGEAGDRASNGGFPRVGRLLGDIASVNLLGVPGAALEAASRGARADRRTSLRQCAWFVVSWFVGIRALAALVGAGHRVPVVGGGLEVVTGVAGSVFRRLADPTHPLGLSCLVLLAASVLRFTQRVERAAGLR